jgi:hypothetical protein
LSFGRWTFFIVVLAAAAGASEACSKGGPDSADPDAGVWAYTGPQSPCSTGPAYNPTQTTFPPFTGSTAPDVAECVARCGAPPKADYSPHGVVWSMAALPNGGCGFEGEVCQMSAVRTQSCPDGRTVGCSLTGYVCRCESGNWRCYSGPAGASACICALVPTDTASDAGSDADASDAHD